MRFGLPEVKGTTRKDTENPKSDVFSKLVDYVEKEEEEEYRKRSTVFDSFDDNDYREDKDFEPYSNKSDLGSA